MDDKWQYLSLTRKDRILTNQFSGMNANFLTKSIASAGVDQSALNSDEESKCSENL